MRSAWGTAASAPAPRFSGGSVGGHQGENGHAIPPPPHSEATGPVVTNHAPSHKVHNLATDIHAIEERCRWLEERNAFLTKRLMLQQKRLIERTLMTSGRLRSQRSFEAWRDAMRELRLERQLDEQTRSLDQCQQVAKELGHALTQEQAGHAATEASLNEMNQDLQKALNHEHHLKNQLKNGQRHVELLERRVHEAENFLIRSRAEAQGVVDTANSYEKEVRELQYEAKQGRHPENPLEHSRQLREQAHGVMHRVIPLLRERPMAPELD